MHSCACMSTRFSLFSNKVRGRSTNTVPAQYTSPPGPSPHTTTAHNPRATTYKDLRVRVYISLVRLTNCASSTPPAQIPLAASSSSRPTTTATSPSHHPSLDLATYRPPSYRQSSRSSSPTSQPQGGASPSSAAAAPLHRCQKHPREMMIRALGCRRSLA